MEEAFIAGLHVIAGGILVFFGAACLAGGLHCGWRLASEVYGPLEFRLTKRVTKQTITYRRDADHDRDSA